MRTQFLPSAAKITPDPIVLPSGHARGEVEKRNEQRAVRRGTSVNQRRELRVVEKLPLFSVCTLGGGFPLLVSAAVFPCDLQRDS